MGGAYVGRTHHSANLLHGVQIGAQATVHREDLFVDDGGNGEAIEAVGKGLPQLDVVPPLAFVVESVDAVDGRALVVSAQDEEVLGILDLVCEEKADCFERLLSAINVVAEEEVICFGWEASIFEEAEEIVVLSVNVSAYLDSRSIAPLAQSRPQKPSSGSNKRHNIRTFMGASNSSRMGWLMKISRAFVHK